MFKQHVKVNLASDDPFKVQFLLTINYDFCLNKLQVYGLGRIRDVEYGHAEYVLYKH